MSGWREFAAKRILEASIYSPFDWADVPVLNRVSLWAARCYRENNPVRY